MPTWRYWILRRYGTGPRPRIRTSTAKVWITFSSTGRLWWRRGSRRGHSWDGCWTRRGSDRGCRRDILTVTPPASSLTRSELNGSCLCHHPELEWSYTAREGARLLEPPDRSEERRVGKECRSRWSP